MCVCAEMVVNVIDHGKAHYKEQLCKARQGVMVSGSLFFLNNLTMCLCWNAYPVNTTRGVE